MAYDVANGLAWYLQLLAVGIVVYILIMIFFFLFAFYNIGKSEAPLRALARIGSWISRR